MIPREEIARAVRAAHAGKGFAAPKLNHATEMKRAPFLLADEHGSHRNFCLEFLKNNSK